MLFGWWEVNGVPSALYSLDFRQRKRERFSFLVLQSEGGERLQNDRLKRRFDIVQVHMLHDLHELCNTFCVSGQGATMPHDLIGGATEYIDRPVRNLPRRRMSLAKT
jgi:hypothetical protein